MSIMSLRCGSDTDPKRLAGAIMKTREAGNDVEILCIGHGAVGQSFKACAIASGFSAQQAMILAIIPGFRTVTVHETEGDKASTAMVMRIIEMFRRDTVQVLPSAEHP